MIVRLRSATDDHEWRFGAVVARLPVGLRFVGLPVELHVGICRLLRSAA